MTNRISARLRALSYHIDETGLVDDVDAKSCTEAADHIDTQSAMIKVLVEALERIDDLTGHNMAMSARDEQCVNREARAALAAAKETT